MAEHRGPSVGLRVLAVVLMGLTVFFTLMGAIGTSCVALGAEKFGSMAVLVPYKPLYQVLVVISLAAGIWGIPVTVALVKGAPKAYRNALIVLVVGAVTAGIQTFVSQAVRGKSAPVNMRFGITAFTLLVFLLFRIPGLWQRLDFTKTIRGRARGASGGAALIICGGLALSAPAWVGVTHMQHWIAVLGWQLQLAGWVMLALGLGLLAYASLPGKKLAIVQPISERL